MHKILSILRKFLVDHWSALLLIGFTIGLHWDLVAGAVPATGDHMIHMYKGWLMSEHLIPTGRVSGWSNMAFAGYPAGVYYPVLGDILITVTKWLTFGAATFERAYAIFVLVLIVAIPMTVYAVARKFCGRFGALTAGVLIAGDVGGWPQGGHVSTIHWAVWPFIVGLLLSMMSVLACESVITKPIRKHPIRFIAFTLLLTCTVIAHPMSTFFLGLGAPTFVVVLAIASRGKHHPLMILARAGAAAFFALILSSFWTVPWITTGTEWALGWPAVGFGGMWLSLPKMLDRIVSNDLFYDFYWVTWLLGAAGLVMAAITRRKWPVFIAILLVLVFLFVGLANAMGDGMMARKVQIERMAAYMKLLWFVLAGYAADQGALALQKLLKKIPEKAATILRRDLLLRLGPVFTVLFLSGIVVLGWSDNYKKVMRLGRLGGQTWEDITQAEKWLAKQEKGPLDRILHQPGKRCIEGNLVAEKCNEVYHRHIFASAPVRTGLPKLKFGYEATAIFKNVPLAHRWPYDTELIQQLLTNPDALKNLHVRWVFSLVEWPDRDDLKLVKRFGKVWLYEVETGKSPPVRLQGPGELEVLEFRDELVKVRIFGATEKSRIMYPIAYFYPWKAYREDEELPLGRHGVLPHARKILMSAPAGDGVTTLVYERPGQERVANWVSLIGWAICLVTMFFFAARRVRRRRI